MINLLHASPYTDFIYRMCEEPTQEQLEARQRKLEKRNEEYLREYQLIKVKKSKLPSAKRKAISDWYERNYLKEKGDDML